MDKPAVSAEQPKCIVLPLQPSSPQAFSGVGLALHFLLGNVIVLHSGFKECWFGWRVHKLFGDADRLGAYCRGAGQVLTLDRISEEQKVRLWIYGTCDPSGGDIFLYDALNPKPSAVQAFTLPSNDDLVGFRKDVLSWFADCGHDYPEEQKEAALWTETISMSGLDAVGRALEAFYVFSSYGSDGKLATDLFDKAVALAPKSFMANNLLGWAHYRNRDFTQAEACFERAVEINPAGTGAMGGLMWCAVNTGDKQRAVDWAFRKAEARQENTDNVEAQVVKRLEKAGQA